MVVLVVLVILLRSLISYPIILNLNLTFVREADEISTELDIGFQLFDVFFIVTQRRLAANPI